MASILHDERNADKILKMTSDPLFIIRNDGICIDAICYNLNSLAIGSENLINKNIFSILPSQTSINLKIEFDKVLKNGGVSIKNYEVPIENELFYVKCIMQRYDDKHILCQCRDITERSRDKKQLEVINLKLQEVEKEAAIGQWEYNPETKIFDYAGYTQTLNDNSDEQSILLKNYIKTIYEEDKAKFEQWLDKMTNKPKAESIEYRVYRNNKLSYLRLKIIKKEFKESKYHIKGYAQNITDLAQERNELEIVTKAVNYANGDIFAMKADGTLTFGNFRFREHLLLPHNKDITNLNLFELGGNQVKLNRWKKLLDEGLRNQNLTNFIIEYPYTHFSDVLALDCFSYIVKNANGEDIFWTFGRDISKQINYERQIKELNQIMNTVLDNIPLSIFVKDTGDNFKYLYRNKIANEFAYSPIKNPIGKTDFEIATKEEAEQFSAEDQLVLSTGEPLETIHEYGKEGDGLKITNDLKLLVSNEGKAPIIIGVGWDITERIVLERELIKAKEKAEESDKLKSAFLANMSHEIRTPLNAIIGFSKIIAETDEAEERKNYFEVVETNNERLLQLINEILYLSKIESGMIEFSSSQTSINTICEETLDAYRFRCPKNVELIYDKPDNDLIINSDRERILHVFSNLIENAFKFTFKGFVKLGYNLKGNFVEFYVKDTGIGIDPKKQKMIFQRFTKINDFAQGTGLGLSICKLIIEKLGGEIAVNSVTGEGSTFTFTLPYNTNREQIKK